MFIHKLFSKKSQENNEKQEISYKDSHIRSLLKGISWRITGTLDTILLSWIITGQFKFAITIGLTEVITKIILYYFHERIWNKINYGKKKVLPPEYQI